MVHFGFEQDFWLGRTVSKKSFSFDFDWFVNGLDPLCFIFILSGVVDKIERSIICYLGFGQDALLEGQCVHRLIDIFVDWCDS